MVLGIIILFNTQLDQVSHILLDGCHIFLLLYINQKMIETNFDSIIVVTDRTNLDDQLRGIFKSLSKVDKRWRRKRIKRTKRIS